MKFLLFSKVSFEVSDPIALIESYCFQSDFYANFDYCLSERKRKVEDVNKIGARIRKGLLSSRTIYKLTENAKKLRIFGYDLDGFLELDDATRKSYINELSNEVIQKLLEIKGIGLSKATKVLHTLYPEIIPIIDGPLQKEYCEKIDSQWTEKQSDQILIDYYNNFKEGDNWQNLSEIFKQIHSNNLVGLTKVRIFDILWWSYLKSKKLRQEKKINWFTIK